MSAVIAVPDLMGQAATDLARIGDTLNVAHMTAAVSTTQVLPAAADEVSASIAHLMSGYGQEYQALAGQAAAFHAQFAQNLTKSAASYASAEDAIAVFLRFLSANANGFVGFLAATPPDALLLDLFILLTLPIWIPILALPFLPLFALIGYGFIAALLGTLRMLTGF